MVVLKILIGLVAVFEGLILILLMLRVPPQPMPAFLIWPLVFVVAAFAVNLAPGKWPTMIVGLLLLGPTALALLAAFFVSMFSSPH